MHASEVTPEAIERANALYWNSDRSVNQIAEDLDLSKGALYGVIEPQHSELGCPLCGDETVYANRTARDRDLLACPTCDWDGTSDETVAVSPPRGNRSSRGVDDWGGGPDPVDAEMDGALTPAPFDMTPERTRSVVGGALLGAAAGLALVLWARRR